MQFNLNEIKQEKKSVGSDVDNDSDYWVMKIARLKIIFQVSPMGMIPGVV